MRYNPQDKTLYVANGKGLSSKAEPRRAEPAAAASPQPRPSTSASCSRGTLGILEMPTPEQMATLHEDGVRVQPAAGQERGPRRRASRPDNPIPRKVGDPSPIKYCIYIIKENRTYDQVFGDMQEGNGEPELCLFPEAVTPNHHKLAREFVLLDNFYVEGEVSADGHEWTMGAYATDFVEKVWPLSYRGSPRKTFGYPSEGQMDPIARPSGGYLWDRCTRPRCSYRSYGEWVEQRQDERRTARSRTARPTVKALEGHFDPKFRGYDLDYPDVKRAERFISELKRFEKAGEMPRLQIVRLPNDHTSGTRVGKPTPTAMVADNDLALGHGGRGGQQEQVLEGDGDLRDRGRRPERPGPRRRPPRRGAGRSRRTRSGSTSIRRCTRRRSMLRTMELILGLKPMSQFDAAARPMYNSFTAKPDLTAYTHVVPKVDLKEVNKPGGVRGGAGWRSRTWRRRTRRRPAVQRDHLEGGEGAGQPMPPPVRAAFFVPVKATKKDDDDE